MNRSARGVVCGAALLLQACAGAPAGPDGGNVARSLAQIDLTFTRRATLAPSFEAQGHFVRFKAAATPALLGLPLEETIPLDTCQLIDGAQEIDRALEASSPDQQMELLDAGRLVLRGPAPSNEAQLEPRHYPELTPYAAGVVYGVGEGAALTLEPGALYEASGEGGEEVGPFEVKALAPHAFPELQAVAFRAGEDLELHWAAAPEIDVAAEPLLVTVSWSTHEARCRVRDVGMLRIAHDLLPAATDATLELTATRTRRTPFYAPGVGRGELAVRLREVVSLDR